MPTKAKDPKKAKPTKPQILIYGEPGIGKTWFALQFPKAVFIDSESGASLGHYTDVLAAAGALYLGREDGAGDFETVIGEVRTLATEQHDRRSLVIDSLSKVFNNSIQDGIDQLERAGKEIAFGNERKHAVGQLRKMMTWINQLDMSVILTCHSKPKYDRDKQVGIEPDIHKDALYDVHLILEATKVGASRYARVVKSRYQQFQENERFALDYDAFCEKWKGSDGN